ncbi:MAG: DUF192 domain-containing protein [Halobacteriales archaeon]
MPDPPGPRLPDRLRWPALVLAVLLVVAAGALAYDELSTAGTPDATTVTVVDADGTELGTVEVRVADTVRERYTGLSDTDSLGPNEGMLFVHDAEGRHAYVMRDMAFPIDIVFVGADRRITAIHHAEVEEPPLTRYRGRGKWVLEVPYNWTVEHGVEVGDRIRIQDRG